MKYLLLLLLCNVMLNAHSQSIDRQQISSYSATLESTSNSIQFIIGDINIMTMEGTSVVLSNLLQLDEDAEITTALNVDLLSLHKVYPNPTAEIIHVELEDFERYAYSIFSIDGGLMTEEQPLASSIKSIDVTDYSQGTYLLLIKDKETHQYQILEFIKY